MPYADTGFAHATAGSLIRRSSALARWERSLPGNMLATNDFAAGAYHQLKSIAVTMREIAPDPDGWIRAIRHDIDRKNALEHVSALVTDGKLPGPSWIIVRPESGHAHVIWDLGGWVKRDLLRQLGLFEHVRAALRDIVGGDPSYVARFQHNPLHPSFECWGVGRKWELSELIDAIGPDVWKARPHRAYSKIDPIAASLGRNCAHFENVRVHAYAVVAQYRRRDDYVGFVGYVNELIRSQNEALDAPLDAKECAKIAASISRWTWTRYRGGNSTVTNRRAASGCSRPAYLAGAAAARAEARQLSAKGVGALEIARQMRRSRSWVYTALKEASARPSSTVQSPALSGIVRVSSPDRPLKARPAARERTYGATAVRQFRQRGRIDRCRRSRNHGRRAPPCCVRVHGTNCVHQRPFTLAENVRRRRSCRSPFLFRETSIVQGERFTWKRENSSDLRRCSGAENTALICRNRGPESTYARE